MLLRTFVELNDFERLAWILRADRGRFAEDFPSETARLSGNTAGVSAGFSDDTRGVCGELSEDAIGPSAVFSGDSFSVFGGFSGDTVGVSGGFSDSFGEFSEGTGSCSGKSAADLFVIPLLEVLGSQASTGSPRLMNQWYSESLNSCPGV
jgi:hypothetical protein